MAIINRLCKYLFLAEPHTGSRAVRQALLTHCGAEEIADHHATIDWLLSRGWLEKDDLRDLHICTVIRNPLDVIVTAHYYRKRMGTLWDTLRAYASKQQFYIHVPDARITCVIRYEDGLEDELNKFLYSIVAPVVRLKHVEPTPGKKHWSTYYDVEMLDFVVAKFSEITRYNYTGEVKKAKTATVRI